MKHIKNQWSMGNSVYFSRRNILPLRRSDLHPRLICKMSIEFEMTKIIRGNMILDNSGNAVLSGFECYRLSDISFRPFHRPANGSPLSGSCVVLPNRGKFRSRQAPFRFSLRRACMPHVNNCRNFLSQSKSGVHGLPWDYGWLNLAHGNP